MTPQEAINSPLHAASLLHEALLTSGIPHMAIDAIDGYLAAIICGPFPLNPTLWLPALFLDDHNPALDHKEKAENLINLVFARYNQIVASLHDNTFEPLLIGDVNQMTSLELWCKGFHKGMIAFGETWIAQSDLYIVRLCLPILYCSDKKSTEPMLDPDLLIALTEQDFDFVEELKMSIPRIRDFWVQESGRG